ncbi:uroporphyrinogen-III synthase [Polymorphobacter sp.]|uniref:uroporphyrinogen-III synthase n=1 Tax=Polymorphobacter sp. TaxID=1909290 RepID=UPI003F72B5BA
MARVLLTRPQPGADATAAALLAAGHEPVVCPLMAYVPCPWSPPDAMPDAVLLTSAAAVRHAGPAILPFRALPALCVGAQTTRAALSAGWDRAETAGPDLETLYRAVAARAPLRLLHLAGKHRAKAVVPAGLSIDTRTVYAAQLLPLDDPGAVDAAMLFSPRSARHFAEQWDSLSRPRAALALLAISAAAAEAAGPGWRDVIVSDQPDEAALLVALARLSL